MALSEIINEQPTQEMADEGRGGDTVLAHLSLGELVIPRAFMDDPDFMDSMKHVFEANGANINQYMVGDDANSINPETGYPEFGFFKKAFKVIKNIALPAALTYFAPGIGTALGATGAGASGLGGAIAGGAGGLLNGGGLKGILSGAALGGVGRYIGAGGINDTILGRGINDAYSGVVSGVNSASNSLGVGNVLNTGGKIFGSSGSSNVLGGAGNDAIGGGGSSSYKGLTSDSLLDRVIGTPTQAGQGPNLDGSAGFDVGGSGIRGVLTSGASNSGGSSVGGYKGLADILSTGLGYNANENAKDELLKANREAAGYLQPFATQQYSAGDLANTEGYKFRLQQGQEAIDARNAAQGGYYSGAAQREAGQFASDFASNEYQNDFQRWLQNQGARFQAASGQANIAGNSGDVRAQSGISNNNLFSRGLSGLLGGGGFNAGGNSYDNNNDALQRLLSRLGA